MTLSFSDLICKFLLSHTFENCRQKGEIQSITFSLLETVIGLFYEIDTNLNEYIKSTNHEFEAILIFNIL